MSSNLGWIAPAVARETRVCVYDRAGHGWSEPAGSPPDGAQTATDLHALLERGEVPGPFVLAGHSFGGLYVQSIAAQYPDDVAGRTVRIATRQEVVASDGSLVPVRAESVCVHGDSPGAVAMATAVRRELKEAGVRVLPFVGGEPG